MTGFFVLVTFCGYLGCNPSQRHDFPSAEACVEFVEAYRRNQISSAATCFDRGTGKVLADSRGRK